MKYIRLYEELEGFEETWVQDEPILTKEEIIKYIKNIISMNNKNVTMKDLKADVLPLYYEDRYHYHLIERLFSVCVAVIVYYEDDMSQVDHYYVDYEDLREEQLLQIKSLIDKAIENNLIKN